MNQHSKQVLSIELGTSPPQVTQALQNIKDAMVHAIMQQIEATGIQDANDPYFTVYQHIYLEAVHLLHCDSSTKE
jgi:hypothetical protein